MQSRSRLQLGIELTQHCDLRCKHCLRGDLSTEVEFDFDLFVRLLGEAEQLGTPHVAFTGGEVTLHRRFFDFGSELQRRGYTWHFVTNGNSYPRIRERLLDFGDSLTGISISLDGATEATHDYLRGRGSFRRVVMAIALAVYDGWRVTVQPVISARNRHELELFHAVCRDLGVHQLIFAHAQPVARADYNQLVLTPEDWKQVDEQVLELAARSQIPVYRSSGHWDPTPFAHCQTLKHMSYNVDCHGRLTFCCQLSGVPGEPNDADVLCDLRHTSLMDAIQSQFELANRVNFERLNYVRNPSSDSDPFKHFHCHFCMKRFGKLAHQETVQLRRKLPSALRAEVVG